MKKEAIRTWIHTSLENMFHRSWYRRCLASNRLTNTLASSSCRQRPLIAYLIYYSDNNCIQYTLVRFFSFKVQVWLIPGLTISKPNSLIFAFSQQTRVLFLLKIFEISQTSHNWTLMLLIFWKQAVVKCM